MTQPSYAKHDLKGPSDVRPWHTLNEKRDGSPCVLERKFGYVRTRHRNLAKAQRHLDEVSALPETERHPNAVENLTRRRDNARAWLDYSIATLEEHLRFAQSRYDGTLDEVRPLASGQKRGSTNRKSLDQTRKLVAYYNEALTEFKLAAAVSAGSWIRLKCSAAKHGACEEYKSGKTTAKYGNKEIIACKHVIAEINRKPIGGHAATEDATEKLIEHAKPIIESFKRRSGREIDVAEQLAFIEVMETAARFDPTEGRCARFNTFYTYRARRATQIRSANDCPPGKTLIKGKIIARGTLHVQNSDNEEYAPKWHPVVTNPDTTLENAVSEALSKLSPDEQDIARHYLMGDDSLRELAKSRGMTLHKVRKLVQQVTAKLQDVLKDFAE